MSEARKTGTEREEVSRGVRACSKQNGVFPGQEHMLQSPDSPRQKPWEGPSPRLALFLPPRAVGKPRPTGQVPLSTQEVASWKFLPLSCPIPVHSVPGS